MLMLEHKHVALRRRCSYILITKQPLKERAEYLPSRKDLKSWVLVLLGEERQ